jgi:deoxyribose-phosphate aldolase
MDQNRPPLTTYEGLAKMIDHSLVRPELTDAEIVEGCEIAKAYQVASVSVRPSEPSSMRRAICCAAAPRRSIWC